MLPAAEARSIVWLASYPKSGNTWIRCFLSRYLRQEDAADINDLHGGPIASSRTLFDHSVGINATCLLDEEIRRLRPQVYRQLREPHERLQYLKVHDAWTRNSAGEPLFPADATRAAVYIVRNPLDVAVSAAHHYGKSMEQAVAQLCDPQFVLARDASAPQLPQLVGCWSTHVRSWLDSGLGVHVVRYEDLSADPQGTFRRLLEHLQLSVDEEWLAAAVASTDFAELKQQEANRGFGERLLRASAPFFRRGIVGAWRDELPTHLAERIIAMHAPLMRDLGYLS